MKMAREVYKLYFGADRAPQRIDLLMFTGFCFDMSKTRCLLVQGLRKNIIHDLRRRGC